MKSLKPFSNEPAKPFNSNRNAPWQTKPPYLSRAKLLSLLQTKVLSLPYQPQSKSFLLLINIHTPSGPGYALLSQSTQAKQNKLFSSIKANHV